MGQAYTPGLKVSPRVAFRARRLLPIKGDVLAKVGDVVEAEQVVAQTFMPGDVTPVNMANLLAMPPGDVRECMLVQEGDTVAVGDELARNKGIFGFMRKSIASKYAGTVETLSDVTGQLILRGEAIPVSVQAYVSGEVVEVIPDEGVVVATEASLVQGIFGIGGEAHGALRMAAKSHQQELTADMILPDMAGQIIVGGARVWHEAIRKAIAVGAAAIVAGGLDDQDLKEILGYDLGVAITGTERIGLTVIVTEGFGDISMAERTFDLLRAHEGHQASVNGATQIRAGVMRPEIVVPLKDGAPQVDTGPAGEAGLLDMGRPVRIIRDPYFGLIGSVCGIPAEPTVLGSGSKARVVEVKLDSGDSVTVPRANVELIEA